MSKYKNAPMSSSAAVERFFQSQEFFVVDDDSGLSATGQSTSGLNFYDDSERSLLAD